jgi:hypothetical protein
MAAPMAVKKKSAVFSRLHGRFSLRRSSVPERLL